MTRSVPLLALVLLMSACTRRGDADTVDSGGAGDSGAADSGAADSHVPGVDSGPPVECLRTFEWDTRPDLPGYDFRTTVHVDQAGHSLRSETRGGDGSLISVSTFVNEGNATVESRDAGGDGSVESRERMTRDYDSLERLVLLTIDRGDDAFVDSALTYTYEDTSHRLSRYDQHETFPDHPPIDTFAIFTSDAQGRLATEEVHLSTGDIDSAVFVYSDPVSPAHIESTLDRGSDGTPDIVIRIDLDDTCELEIGPEDILI
jgi:hypothetical protein